MFPANTEQVAPILALASQHHIPVTPRGAGTNLCAGTVPIQGGIVLVLTRLNRILEVNAEDMLVRVEPGVTAAALADTVDGAGLLYPPDPGSRTVATIGGNVATCAGGLRRLKYGVTRNYVLGLTAVLPTGEVIHTGGRLWKDVAGYDLTRLLTGSEGTLAVLTELTLARLPKPATNRTGLAYFPTSPPPAAQSPGSWPAVSYRPPWSSLTSAASRRSSSTPNLGYTPTPEHCCSSATMALIPPSRPACKPWPTRAPRKAPSTSQPPQTPHNPKRC